MAKIEIVIKYGQMWSKLQMWSNVLKCGQNQKCGQMWSKKCPLKIRWVARLFGDPFFLSTFWNWKKSQNNDPLILNITNYMSVVSVVSVSHVRISNIYHMSGLVIYIYRYVKLISLGCYYKCNCEFREIHEADFPGVLL